MTTREQVIAAAKEAGMGGLEEGGLIENFERFHTIIANQTKDECAALCYEQNWLIHGAEMAALIEATKETEE